MKSFLNKLTIATLILFTSATLNAQDFQGKAYYFSKTPMDLGAWGARMSEAQKKTGSRALKKQIRKNLYFNV